MKKYKKMIILTTLLTGLPILIGLILWSKLPDSMATHWDVNGQANGWSGKGTTVFFLPCILMIIHLFAVFLTLNDPKKTNIHKKPMTIIFWIVPVISILMNGVIYLDAFGNDDNILDCSCYLDFNEWSHLFGCIRNQSKYFGCSFHFDGDFIYASWQLYAKAPPKLYDRHQITLDIMQ